MEKAKERNDSLYEGTESLETLRNRCHCGNPILEVDNCINALNQKDIMMQNPNAQKDYGKLLNIKLFQFQNMKL